MLPEYQLQIIEDNNVSLGKNKKLSIHYQNLKLYLNLGYKKKEVTKSKK